jgi:uncharacterized protein (TIGR01777 family)
MRVLVAGGTGFVGGALRRSLRGAGHTVLVVTRTPHGEGDVGWDQLGDVVSKVEAVVNLAGEPIAGGRWTSERKAAIRDSRVQGTRRLVEALDAAARRPRVLVNASAIGWYGDRGDEPLDERAGPGEGFLAEVCRDWEAEALRAEPLGVRVVRLRIGIVLAPDGGALARMLPPFRAFVGGRLGSGRQWMSWVHRDDVVGLLRAAIASEEYRGPVNATAPRPVTNREFTETLARVLGRPAIVSVPALGLRLALGEMAEMLLAGQRVFPAAAERAGYRFRFTDLATALRACLRGRGAVSASARA